MLSPDSDIIESIYHHALQAHGKDEPPFVLKALGILAPYSKAFVLDILES